MKINDRGLQKWRGFMMPEHLSEMASVDWDGHKQPMPTLDEYELAELESRIQFAMESKVPVRITVHIGGYSEEVTGVIKKADPITKEMRVGDEFKRVNWADIIGVEIVDD